MTLEIDHSKDATQGLSPEPQPPQKLLDYVDWLVSVGPALSIPKHLGSELHTIKITGTPDGLAPENIRKSWVGVTLKEAREGRERIEFTGGNIGEAGSYYGVPTGIALEALLKHSVDAVRWWATIFPIPAYLYFNKTNIEVLGEQESKAKPTYEVLSECIEAFKSDYPEEAKPLDEALECWVNAWGEDLKSCGGLNLLASTVESITHGLQESGIQITTEQYAKKLFYPEADGRLTAATLMRRLEFGY